jgi:hypothetical protein
MFWSSEKSKINCSAGIRVILKLMIDRRVFSTPFLPINPAEQFSHFFDGRPIATNSLPIIPQTD